MESLSAKDLRKQVVDNIEKCENFKDVFEMIFESKYSEFKKFKAKHYQEGEFTDEDGVIVLATSYYLGVTLRIFSRSNTKIQPYTEYNENQPIVFNIFLDDRNKNSEHFQSLRQPDMKQFLDNKMKTSKFKREAKYGAIPGKKDNNFSVQTDHNDHNDEEEKSGKKEDSFPFQNTAAK